MTDSGKKEYLNTILKLNVFEDCSNWANEKLKINKTQLKMIEQQINSQSLDTIKTKIENVMKQIDLYESQKKTYRFIIDKCAIVKQKQPILEKNDNLSEYDTSNTQNILKSIEFLKNKIKHSESNFTFIQKKI